MTVTGIGEYAGEITTSYRVICEHSNSEGVCTICGEIADESLLYGDIHLDGRLTIADAVLLVRLLTEDGSAPIDPETLDRSDVDRDGVLTVLDTSALLKLLASANA